MKVPVIGAAAQWLDPGPPQLRGHVVLYDFWTLTCVNWLRTAPWRRAWSSASQARSAVSAAM